MDCRTNKSFSSLEKELFFVVLQSGPTLITTKCLKCNFTLNVADTVIYQHTHLNMMPAPLKDLDRSMLTIVLASPFLSWKGLRLL